jgi:HEXXH motif-containing protein
MTAPSLPSFVTTADVMAASVRLAQVEVDALWSRFRPYAMEHGAGGVALAIDELLALGAPPDSARVHHWCHISKAILRSFHQGLDPAPSYVSHFLLDSLEPDRLIQLHAFRLLAALIAGRLSDATITLDIDGAALLPLDIDLGAAGAYEIPADHRRGPWRIILRPRHVVWSAGEQAVTDDVPMPGLKVTRPASWRHLPPLFVTHGDQTFLAPIHDRGLREPYSATAPVVWDAQAVGRWLPTLRIALERCHGLDERLYEECAQLTPEVLPLYHGIGQLYGSASNIDVPGYTYLPGIAKPLDVAECLVHEAMHQKLFRIEHVVPLFERDSPADEIFYSPWRVDPRPLRMLLHGCYVFAHVAWMWRAWSLAPPPELPSAQAGAEIAYRRCCEVLAGVDLLRRFAKLTGRGRAVLDEIAACAAEIKDAAPVSGEHRAQVNADLAKHRERHLRTSQCSDPITF